jgi:hypothetical protein
MQSIQKFWTIINIIGGLSISLLFGLLGETKFSMLIAGVGVFWGLLSFIPYRRKAEMLMSISCISFSILLIEGVFYWVVPRPCIRDFAFTTQAQYSPDSVSGFRVQGQEIRFCRIVNNKIAYDNANYKLTTNRQGYNSKHDFAEISNDSLTRMLWMGDSFSAGLYLKHTIADRLEYWLRFKGIPREVFNYSIDGGGIKNWYQMYVRQGLSELPHQDLVLAIFADNLNRDFAIARTTDEHIEFGRTELPQGDWSLWLAQQERVFKPILHRLSIEAADSMVAYASGAPVCMGFRQGLQIERWWLQWLYYRNPNAMIQQGPDAMGMLTEIANICEKKGRKLTLLSVPDISIYQGNGVNNAHHRMLDSISKRLGCEYINGYEAWAHFPSSLVPGLYLQGDRHWNQRGSDWMAFWLCHSGKL